MDNTSIIKQQFSCGNKLIGTLWYRTIRTMRSSVKIATIYIEEVEIIDQKYFHMSLQDFLDKNSIVGNIVILKPTIKGLENCFPHKICKEFYYLRHDQFLIAANVYDNNLFDRSLEISNNFFKMNKIQNWTYRTKKDNKKVFKEAIENGAEIYRSAFSYVIYNNDCIEEYAYEDFKDFMRLVSRFPKGTIIESYKVIDKRHFTKLEGEKIMGYSNKKINLFL